MFFIYGWSDGKLPLRIIHQENLPKWTKPYMVSDVSITTTGIHYALSFNYAEIAFIAPFIGFCIGFTVYILTGYVIYKTCRYSGGFIKELMG